MQYGYEQWVWAFSLLILAKSAAKTLCRFVRPAGGSPRLARVSHNAREGGFARVRTCEYNKNADSFLKQGTPLVVLSLLKQLNSHVTVTRNVIWWWSHKNALL